MSDTTRTLRHVAAPVKKKSPSVWAKETAIGRTRRARRIDRELTLVYPDAHCELDFTNALETMASRP